jgi:hypothetical protein
MTKRYFILEAADREIDAQGAFACCIVAESLCRARLGLRDYTHSLVPAIARWSRLVLGTICLDRTRTVLPSTAVHSSP